MNDYIYIGTERINGFFLAHHGIKGQKWGVRRFQNPDGTLTELGRQRLNKFVDKNGRRPSSYAPRFNDEDKTLKRGLKTTKVILNNYERKGLKMPKSERQKIKNKKDIYVSAGGNKKDTDFYVSWFADGGYQTEGVSVKELTLTKNVKVASGKKVWDEIVKEIGDTKLSEVMRSASKKEFGGKYSRSINAYFEATTIKEAIEANNKYGRAYTDKYSKKAQWLEALANAGEHATQYAALTFTSDEALKGKVIEKLKKSGYGALEDVNDPDTTLPVVLFDAPKQVKETKSESADEYIERRRKEGWN